MSNKHDGRSPTHHRRRLARIKWAGRASRFLFALGILIVVGLGIIWKLAPATQDASSRPAAVAYTTRSVDGLIAAKVDRVIDGDTIDVVIDGQTHRIRYIGMDTPERGEAGYQVATQRNRQLISGDVVHLEKDISETDRYARLLRYVYLRDGRMVNEILVAEGWAKAIAYPPDVKYADRFQAAEDSARTAERGLWTR